MPKRSKTWKLVFGILKLKTSKPKVKDAKKDQLVPHFEILK